MGGNRTGLVQPDVPLVVPHREHGSIEDRSTIRSAGEVSEDGQSFTAEYTVELTGEGAPAGEFGPGSVTGTRINVEPMGTPVAPVEALFPDLFPPEEGTAPAGTAPLESTRAGPPPAGTDRLGTTPGDAAVATTTG